MLALLKQLGGGSAAAAGKEVVMMGGFVLICRGFRIQEKEAKQTGVAKEEGPVERRCCSCLFPFCLLSLRARTQFTPRSIQFTPVSG